MADIFEYDIFLSFASSDEEIVKPIWQELCLSGLRVFWSDAALKKEVGNSWFEVIQSSLEKSRHLLLICTSDSMNSKWVQREYSAFFNHCYIPKVRRLVPILMQSYKASDLPLFFKDIEALHFDGAGSVQDLISILGGVNIEELRSENEFLKQNLESLSHEKSSLEAQIKSLSEQLAQQEQIQKPDPRTELNNYSEEIPGDRKSFGVFAVEPAKQRKAFEFLGLPSEATSKQIAERYWEMKREYASLIDSSPRELKEVCELRLTTLKNNFDLIYPLRKREEKQKVEQAFEMLQLPNDADQTQIMRRFAEMRRTCLKAIESSDLFIKEAAAKELHRLEEAYSLLRRSQQ